MASAEHKLFGKPDQVQEFPKGKANWSTSAAAWWEAHAPAWVEVVGARKAAREKRPGAKRPTSSTTCRARCTSSCPTARSSTPVPAT